MFKLDNAFLEELGLASLPVTEKNKLLQHIYETLEMRVGMRLAENMTDEQLNEFEAFIDRNDEAGALKWLEQNFPNYRDVVSQELDRLRNEVRADAPQIMAAVTNPQALNGYNTPIAGTPYAGPSDQQYGQIMPGTPGMNMLPQQNVPSQMQYAQQGQVPSPSIVPVGWGQPVQPVMNAGYGAPAQPIQQFQQPQPMQMQQPVYQQAYVDAAYAEPSAQPGVAFAPQAESPTQGYAPQAINQTQYTATPQDQGGVVAQDSQQVSVPDAPDVPYPQSQPPAGPGR